DATSRRRFTRVCDRGGSEGSRSHLIKQRTWARGTQRPAPLIQPRSVSTDRRSGRPRRGLLPPHAASGPTGHVIPLQAVPREILPETVGVVRRLLSGAGCREEGSARVGERTRRAA